MRRSWLGFKTYVESGIFLFRT